MCYTTTLSAKALRHTWMSLRAPLSERVGWVTGVPRRWMWPASRGPCSVSTPCLSAWRSTQGSVVLSHNLFSSTWFGDTSVCDDTLWHEVDGSDTGKAGLMYEWMCWRLRCALVTLYTWGHPRCCNPADFSGFPPSPIPCEPGGRVWAVGITCVYFPSQVHLWLLPQTVVHGT